MRIPFLLVGVAAFLMLASPVLMSRAIADDAATCSSEHQDAKIAACTNAINSGRWSGAGLSWAYKNLAKGYYDKGDYNRAIAEVTEAIRLDPKLSNPYTDRGQYYYSLKKYDEAIANFDQAILLNSGDIAWAYGDRGNAYYAKGEDQKAIDNYDHAIAIDPNYAAAYTARGLLYEKAGAIDRALADYTASLKVSELLHDDTGWAHDTAQAHFAALTKN